MFFFIQLFGQPTLFSPTLSELVRGSEWHGINATVNNLGFLRLDHKSSRFVHDGYIFQKPPEIKIPT